MSFNFSTSTSGNVNLTDCKIINPWCGVFGAQQVIEIIYLTIVTVIGTFGNLMVIFSIILEERVYKHGNLFVINLAVADLIVTGIHIPTVIANVVQGGNALPDVGCKIIGFTITSTCVCSVCNLTFIALNRYWGVVRRESYHRVFSKERIYLMVTFTWFWSFLIVTPTLYNWSNLVYDYKVMQCSWDDTASIIYNVILMVFAIFVPLCIISFCYWKLYLNVRERGRWVRNVASGLNTQFNNPERGQKSLKREKNLLKTLAMTVVAFVICWVPYGLCILINPIGVHHQAKKILGWTGLSNSAINFIIYGAMNPVYRKGYKNLLEYVFCCAKCRGETQRRPKIPTSSERAARNKRNRMSHLGNDSNSFSGTVTPQSTPKAGRRQIVNGAAARKYINGAASKKIVKP